MNRVNNLELSVNDKKYSLLRGRRAINKKSDKSLVNYGYVAKDIFD